MEKKRNLWVIPTDKPSRILFDKEENRLLPLQDSTVFMQYQDLVENQHIYITNDEEIKEGDYWIYICPINGLDYGDNNNPIVKNNLPNSWFNKLHDKLNYKKIILTTDQDLIKDGVQSIDDEFLEWFVKNPSCERVEVYKDKRLEFEQDFHFYEITIPKEEPKHPKVFSENGNELFFDEQGNMIKEEPKQQTLEEASKEYVNKNYTDYTFKKVLESIFIAGAKWQQERMYSEEDLREAYIAGCKNPLLYKTHEEKAIDWYKQYKK